MGPGECSLSAQQIQNGSRRSRDHLRDGLRLSIERGEVVPHYQPIVDVRSGRILRFEALARWPDLDRDWVPPVRFIPMAERYGMIGPLTRSLLRRALSDLARWRRTYPDLRVSVNLSPRSLGRSRFADDITAVLEGAGASPDWLALEITENAVVNDIGHARSHIERLRALGVRIDIDDFGTGYSSLRYLQILAVDSVKVDRQFVEASVVDRTSETIVRAVISLCHELGFETVAEGVAGRSIWDLVAALGCDSAQGHLIAPAMPGEDVDAWLAAWSVRRATFASAAPRRPTGPALDGEGPRVLVVDDEPAILSIVRDALRQEGYRVETATNGVEALRAVEARPPDLVLLDIHMPILDGEGFVKALRERGTRVPVVVMTAGPSAEHWARQLGVEGAMAKPFGIADLTSVASRFTRDALLVS